jgi:hypothetical protein
MTRVFAAVGLLCAACVLAGCGRGGKPGDLGPNAAPADAALPTAAQPKLQTLKLWLGAEEMIAELALTPAQQRAGMMYRTSLAENEGMLFAFPGPHRAAFWMKNCVLPLSAAYIDPEGIILEIHALEPGNTNSVVASTDRVQYVLETRQGWFDRHQVGVGTLVRTERGALKDTFMQHNQQ